MARPRPGGLIQSRSRGGRGGSAPGGAADGVGDVAMTRLLLGLGLRSFSMHPSQILSVKQQVLRSDCAKLAPWAEEVLDSEDPASDMAR
jgi:phosphotransferase system enzyme I (PtsI)